MKKLLVIILLFSLLNTSCMTLKEQYKEIASEIKQYCVAVLKDAGFKKKDKEAMARCIQSKEQSERQQGSLFSISLNLLLISLFGIKLVF